MMHFNGYFLTPNGVELNYFKVVRAELTLWAECHVTLTISGWPDEAAASYGTDQGTLLQRTLPAPPALLASLSGAALSTDILTGAEAATSSTMLESAKLAKSLEINAARLRASRSSFDFAGHPVSADELSRSDIDAVAALVARTAALPPGWPGFWKAADNSLIPIPDVATWDALYSAMYQAGLANFVHAQALKERLQIAATSEAVGEIRWGMDMSSPFQS